MHPELADAVLTQQIDELLPPMRVSGFPVRELLGARPKPSRGNQDPLNSSVPITSPGLRFAYSITGELIGLVIVTDLAAH